MKRTVIAILMTLLVGCTTYKKMYTTKTVVTDTTSISYLPRTINVPLMSDTVKIYSPILIETVKDSVWNDTVYVYKDIPIASLDTVFASEGLVGAAAWVEWNNLFVEAYLMDSTLIYKNDSLLKVVDRLIKVDTQTKETVVKEKKVIPTIAWIGIGVLGLVIFFGIKNMIKIPF